MHAHDGTDTCSNISTRDADKHIKPIMLLTEGPELEALSNNMLSLILWCVDIPCSIKCAPCGREAHKRPHGVDTPVIFTIQLDQRSVGTGSPRPLQGRRGARGTRGEGGKALITAARSVRPVRSTRVTRQVASLRGVTHFLSWATTLP